MHAIGIPVHRFSNGQTIFWQYDLADALYLIRKGQVRILLFHNGVETTLAVLARGEVIGDAALIAGTRHSVSAVAVGETELEVVSRSDLEGAMRDPLAHKLLVTLAKRLQRMDGEYERLALTAERQRRCLEAIEHRGIRA